MGAGIVRVLRPTLIAVPRSSATTGAIVTVQSLGSVALDAAVEDLMALLATACGADIAVTMLDAATPTKAVVASGRASD